MVPFTREAVPEVKPTAGFVVVDPVAAGLIADEDDSDGAEEGETQS